MIPRVAGAIVVLAVANFFIGVFQHDNLAIVTPLFTVIGFGIDSICCKGLSTAVRPYTDRHVKDYVQWTVIRKVAEIKKQLLGTKQTILQTQTESGAEGIARNHTSLILTTSYLPTQPRSLA